MKTQHRNNNLFIVAVVLFVFCLLSPFSASAALTTINITQFPINNTLQVGHSWGMAAEALDQAGVALLPAPTITWASSDTSVATMSATPNTQGTYVLTATAAGTTTITASSGGISGSILITVTAAPQTLGSIAISPFSTSADVGSTSQFTATAYDTNGILMSTQPIIVWLVDFPAIATVNNSGLVTAVSPGTTSVTATSGSKYTSASFTATAIPGTFGITASAGVHGTVSPTGYTSILSGGSQTYTITPSAGYAVSDVLVDGTSVGAMTSYTFTNIIANHTISASFSFIPAVTFNIVASSGANGSITPIGTTTVTTGGSQAYTITPTASYQVADVLVDGVSVGAVTTYTFTNVVATHTISATFIPTPVVLSALVAGWNLIGWTAVPTTADAFALANPGVNIVSRFNNTTKQWTDYILNIPLNKFTINPGDGLFIHKL
jgi:hypothetical protein